METLERILVEHPFFAGADRGCVQRFVGCASNLKWEAGKVIFREGEPAEEVYLLRHGRVAVERSRDGGPPQTIESLDPGDVLGWSWLIPPFRWNCDARAVTLTRALALSGTCLREKSEQDPEFGYLLMKRMAEVMARRVEHASLQWMDVYGKAP